MIERIWLVINMVDRTISGDRDDELDSLSRVGEEGIVSFASYRWPNGDAYDGFWKEGKMHGLGTLKWANGDSYEGCWVEGRIEGKGKKTKLEAGVVEEGEYKDGVVNGVVHRVMLKSGDKFNGNDLDGYGEYTWATERYVYQGEWYNGNMHGVGRLSPIFASDDFITDRSIVERLRDMQEKRSHALERQYDDPGWVKSYSGNYRVGRRHGFGVSVLYDGSEYSGEWKDDLFDGNGRLTFSSESTYTCDNLTLPRNFSQDVNLESMEELKKCSKINIVLYGNFRAGRANGRGVMGQIVNRMPFGDGDVEGNRRGAEFLLTMERNSQALHLNGMVAFDKEHLMSKLMEEDEVGEPPGSGGVHWSVFQLASTYHGFVYEGLFVDGDAQGEGIMYNIFDRSFDLTVCRSKERWKVI